VDFLLLIIELFSPGVTAKIERKLVEKRRFRFEVTVSVWPKFQVQGVVPHQPFSCRTTGMIVLSCDVRILAEVSFIFYNSLV